MTFLSKVDAAAWSPCSGLIAISRDGYPPTIEILDATTLAPLTVLDSPWDDVGYANLLAFSPDGCLLTWFGGGDEASEPVDFINWDVRTGVPVSTNSIERQGESHDRPSVAYSACGAMFGVLFTSTISTYDVFSGTRIYFHSVEEPVLDQIWTHGNCLRFATAKSKSITIWEIGFTSTHAPTMVESLYAPDSFLCPEGFLLHPILPRLASHAIHEPHVCGTQDSETLLDSLRSSDGSTSFSLDGRFFARMSTQEEHSSEIELWKESHASYTPHRTLISDFKFPRPLISPNGRSIIAFGDAGIQLWHTMDSATSTSTIPTRDFQNKYRDLVLAFSPDEGLAAVVRMGYGTITVVDLESGILLLTIDASMVVFGLGVAGNSIVAVGDKGIVTWNLPAGDRIPNLTADITNSVRTITLNHGWSEHPEITTTISVSPDLHRIAIVDGINNGRSHLLYLYDVPTGEQLGSVPVKLGVIPWFTPDGCEVWCGRALGEVDRWKIVEDRESGITKLEHLGLTTHRPKGLPWQPRGYQVAEDDQWILSSSTGKKLFWLPPRWRSYRRCEVWGRRFLALVHDGLPEAVILELE